MNKTASITIVVLAGIIVCLIALDVFFNWEHYRFDPEGSSNNNGIPTVIQDNQNTGVINQNSNLGPSTALFLSPEMLSQAGMNNSRIVEVKEGKDLFSIRLESLEPDIYKRYLYQDEFILGMVYELAPGVTYDQVKQILSDKIKTSPVYTLNETNSFGQHSFYLNNSNRPTTIFLVVEFPQRVLGLEFPKDKKTQFDALLEYVKQNT